MRHWPVAKWVSDPDVPNRFSFISPQERTCQDVIVVITGQAPNVDEIRHFDDCCDYCNQWQWLETWNGRRSTCPILPGSWNFWTTLQSVRMSAALSECSRQSETTRCNRASCRSSTSTASCQLRNIGSSTHCQVDNRESYIACNTENNATQELRVVEGTLSSSFVLAGALPPVSHPSIWTFDFLGPSVFRLTR